MRLFWVSSYLEAPSNFILKQCVKSNYERGTYEYVFGIFRLIMIITHFYACIWIWLGTIYVPGSHLQPWLIENADTFADYSDLSIYIFAIYWIMETVSTVGYGDYSGQTIYEYSFTMLVQFTGLLITSVLMVAITKFIDGDFTFDSYIELKFRQLDLWITRVEKSNRPKYIQPNLFYEIRKNLEISFAHDFNVIIEDFGFY